MERAPEVFEVGEGDLSHVIATDFDDALRTKAERAARSCPRQAITIEP